MEAGRLLVNAIGEEGLSPRTWGPRPYVTFLNVPSSLVLQFLGNYRFHEKHVELSSDLLCGYIADQVDHGELTSWSVSVVTKKTVTNGKIDLGLEDRVPLITRTAHERGTEQAADIKALMSGGDVLADIWDLPTGWQSMSRPEMRSVRTNHREGTPLLLLYPIAKDSSPDPKPNGSAGPRRPLDAAAHVLGLAAVFPEASVRTPQEYVTVDMSGLKREEPEYVTEGAD